MATTTDLEIYRGEDRVLYFIVTPTTDITGWEIEFNLSRSKNTSIQLLIKDGVITDAAAGEFTVTLTAAETSALTVGTYYWDAWKVNASGERVLGIGKFTVTADVRRPE